MWIRRSVVIAYEPIWAIGPGKTPPDEAYITKIGTYIKEMTGGMDVVYGGGLKYGQCQDAGFGSCHGRRPDCPHQVPGDSTGFYPEESLEIVRTYLERE